MHYGAAVLTRGDAASLMYAAALQDAEIYLINLSRATPKNFNDEDMYSTIEGIKDGMYLCTKYESKLVLRNCPHVWVFANALPKRGMLSRDRLHIWSIDKQTNDLRVYKGIFDEEQE